MTTLNVHAQRALSALVIAGTLTAAAYGGMALADAEPTTHSVDTINLSDIPDIDSLPVCHVEDCSDVPGQTGVWYSRSTGDWLLERGEDYTRVIVDDTVVPAIVDHGTATSPQGDGAPAAADGAVPGPGNTPVS